MYIKHLFVTVFSVFVLLGAGCQKNPIPLAPIQNDLSTPTIETPADSNTVQIEAEATVVPVKSAPEASSKTKAVKELVANKTVIINNFAFGPKTITVKKGAVVTWINKDSAPHNVVNDSGVFSSNILSNGQSFSFTFNNVGTYSYICSLHPSMTAEVVVTE